MKETRLPGESLKAWKRRMGEERKAASEAAALAAKSRKRRSMRPESLSRMSPELPDIETFELTAAEVAASDAYEDEQHEFMQRREFRLASMNSRDRERMIDAMVDELGISGGWYWQACFPGCLPDGEPVGPFATKAEALADAQGEQ